MADRRGRGGQVLRSWMAVLAVAAAISSAGCDGPEEEELIAEQQSVEVSTFPATAARQWMVNLGNSVKWDSVSPPVAARTYAYSAVAMYEALVHGMPGYQSLAGQLNGLDALPTPDPALEYDWPTVLAHTMGRVTRFPDGGVFVYPNRIFYEFTTPVQASLSNLAVAQIGYRRAAGVPEEVIADSIAYADELADALIAWANADGYHQLRYEGFIPPTGPDKWVPTGFSDQAKVSNPAEPHFGEVRPMALVAADECDPPAPPPFSTEEGGAWDLQARVVLDTAAVLTQEQRDIAGFWADGPGASATPAGHWVALTTKYVRSRDLGTAVHAYAQVSIGFHDAFIGVWHTKFEHNLLRPETYIRRHLDPDWQPLLPTPQFPTWVSGHSGQSGASGVLLDAFFEGELSQVVDDTKIRRGFGPRTFASFSDAAEEAALSRLYGGIHFPMDNSQGLELGRCVGDRVLQRVTFQP